MFGISEGIPVLSESGEGRAQEAPDASARVFEVCLRFGVPMRSPGPAGLDPERLGLSFAPASVTLVVGPSGSGKSWLLAEIGRRIPTARFVEKAFFPLDVRVIDAVLPTRPVHEAMALLTACGLGEPALWLRGFHELSQGERFRARLARAIGIHRRSATRAPLLCDEFGALLHRRLARAMAFNLRKLVTRERFALVVATSQCDLETDLAPDRVIRLPPGGQDWREREPARAEERSRKRERGKRGREQEENQAHDA